LVSFIGLFFINFYFNSFTGKTINIEKGSFSHIRSYFVANHTPHHNGYDEIIKKDESVVIKGKFQYGDLRKDLEDEKILIHHLNLNDEKNEYEYITEVKTDDDGKINYLLDKKLEVGFHLFRLTVKGDKTFAYTLIHITDEKSNNKYVVFDMDGTLTVSDKEISKEYYFEIANVNYLPKMYENAADVVNYYYQKGFNILYLTARPYWLSSNSQQWLINKNFPKGILITYPKSGIILGEKVKDFKYNILKSLKDKGIDFKFTYGNAKTDIEAYSELGLKKAQIFIIGENNKDSKVTPIENYSTHLKELKK